MDKIDPNLAEAMQDEPDQAVPVLITCTGGHAPVLTMLEAFGVSARRDLLPLGILVARLKPAQITELAGHGNVEALALDEEASTQ